MGAEEVLEQINSAEKIIIGLGEEWNLAQNRERLLEAYGVLWNLTKGKDLWVVTTATDGLIYETAFDPHRVTAPCGNIHWFQCSEACTKDIWEEGEIPDGICPHCGAALTANTIQAKTYIEEGYLPQWQAYKKWQTGTLNRKLLFLELGVGLAYPTVIRWPFEKITLINEKAFLLRVHQNLSQLPEGLKRADRVRENSVEWVLTLESKSCPAQEEDRIYGSDH